MPPAQRPRPRVAMLLRNAYTHDTRVEKEARTLVDGGYDVTVVADAGPDLPRREARDGATVVRVARSGPPIPGVRFLRHELRLAAVLRDLAPDVLHAHDSNALLPVALAAGLLRVPFVYDAHELWLHRPRRGRGALYTAAFFIYYRLLHRWAIPRASATLTVSGPIARHLERHYGLDRVDLVPNYPEPLGLVEPRDLRSLASGAISPEAPIVLHLGGMMAERGLEELVAAMTSVPGAHLVLLGSGEHWPRLERLARDLGVHERTHRLGPVPSEQVIGYSAAASVGVQATVPTGLNNRYSLPNKLFQYMAAGLPVVASDFRQIREVVEGSGCGFVVDTTKPAEIAAALNRILSDPTEARAMGEGGRRAVAGSYTWSAAARTLIDVYARLIR